MSEQGACRILHIVYYDPFDADEEAYVAQGWCELGKPVEQIATLYAAMREWRIKRPPIPHYEAVDAAYYPDMAFATNRAGLTSYGLMVVRNLMRAYRAPREVQP